jgi:hypothetical protein
LVKKHAPPARLAFQGRVVELLDLLPAFRAYPNEFTLCGVRCIRDRACERA